MTTQLEQSSLRQAIIDQIVQGIQEPLVPDELLPTTVTQLQTALGASRCLIFQTDTDRQITACYVSSATNDGCETLVQTLQTRFDQSLSQGQAVVLPHTLIVPLMYQQEYLGSTILESDRALDAQAVAFVKRVAAHCAIAIGQAALGEREERFRHIFAASPMGIALCDREGNLLEVNQAFCHLLGYTESELYKMKFSQFTHPEDIEAEIVLFRQCLEGKINSYQIEKRYIDKHRKIIWVNLSVGVILGPGGQMRYGLGMVFDITARKQAEERWG